MLELKEEEFNLFKEFIYNKVGITLADSKLGLIGNRLKKRVVALKLGSFEEYYKFLKNNHDELTPFISAVTTNITSFFREPRQWEYLEKNFLDFLKNKGDKSLRIWSAGCSTGEEPYTISIFLHELLGEDLAGYNVSILATDISDRVLSKASNGVYSVKDIEELSEERLKKYFEKSGDDYKIKQNIKKIITFQPFNLIYDDYSKISGKFDIIFCRNVMIYFDIACKRKIIMKFIDTLHSKGLLLVGHSESLMLYTEFVESQNYGVYQKRK